MNELSNGLFVEKWRPGSFDEVVFEHKDTLLNYLKKPESLPSFIFYSSSPGTGKTTIAKLIAKVLDCDIMMLNSSMERGIDTIRDKISLYAQSLSSKEGMKRLVFLDEADGLTKQSFDSLRNLMEEYSDNVFFIFSCNDISKITEPIRSRCVTLNFEKPPKGEIMDRLIYICEKENIEYDPEDIAKLVTLQYPDMRSMILTLQSTRIDNLPLLVEFDEFNSFLQTLLCQDANGIYSKAFSQSFNLLGFNRWFFKHIFENYDKYGYDRVNKITLMLAEIEKSWELGANLNIIFVANMLEIAKILQ